MRTPSRLLAWSLLAAASFAAMALVVGPAWYVQPFRPQTAAALDRALAVRELAPVATLALVLFAVALAWSLWTGSRGWWRRAALVLLPALAILAGGLARFNHFEAMFGPLPHPQFAHAGDADFVEPKDVVLAITVGGEAAAYPVRQLAYHHLVQDVVGGVPIVATY